MVRHTMEHTGLVSVEHCNFITEDYLAIGVLLQVLQMVENRLGLTNNAVRGPKSVYIVLGIVSGCPLPFPF